MVELETVGAKTLATRHAILGSFPELAAEPPADASGPVDRWIVVASNSGSARHPGWFLNMAKHPDKVWITSGKRRIKVRPETLEGAEREGAWQRVTSLAPGYARYEHTTDRTIPIVRLIAEEER